MLELQQRVRITINSDQLEQNGLRWYESMNIETATSTWDCRCFAYQYFRARSFRDFLLTPVKKGVDRYPGIIHIWLAWIANRARGANQLNSRWWAMASFDLGTTFWITAINLSKVAQNWIADSSNWIKFPNPWRYFWMSLPFNPVITPAQIEWGSEWYWGELTITFNWFYPNPKCDISTKEPHAPSCWTIPKHYIYYIICPRKFDT